MKALYETKSESMEEANWKELEAKGVVVIRLCLVEVVKFDRTGNFGLWQRRVKDLLEQ